MDLRVKPGGDRMQPVFRFAPSPNGYLHLGHALSALLNADMARAKAGRLLLRIEDIDTARCRPEYEAAIYEDLAWLGLAVGNASAAAVRALGPTTMLRSPGLRRWAWFIRASKAAPTLRVWWLHAKRRALGRAIPTVRRYIPACKERVGC